MFLIKEMASRRLSVPAILRTYSARASYMIFLDSFSNSVSMDLALSSSCFWVRSFL